MDKKSRLNQVTFVTLPSAGVVGAGTVGQTFAQCLMRISVGVKEISSSH